MPRPKPTYERCLERFHSKIDRHSHEGGCHIWMAGTREGYGVMDWIGRQKSAHVIAWELENGPVPPGLHVHHECRNRLCCNPGHLRVVTVKEHVRVDDTPAGRNAVKTHCPKGHPYDERNTQVSCGRRHCRHCRRDKARDRYRALVNVATCGDVRRKAGELLEAVT